MKRLSAVVCGLLFGLGLSISGMDLPSKVLGFLNVAGRWDASLLFVLGGAVAVTAIAFPLVRRRAKPLYDASFERIAPERIDLPLLGGAALFGVGWGMTGYCPGPGIVALTRLAPDAIVFVATFLVGSLLYRMYIRRSARGVIERASDLG